MELRRHSGHAQRWPALSTLTLAYAVGPASLAVIWALRAWHVVANLPLLTYVGLYALGTFASMVTNTYYARHPSRLSLNLRVASHACATTLVIYATGWGPVIGVVYAFTAQENVKRSGPATWRLALLWDCAFVGAAQTGIALGLVPSFLPVARAQGAAFLGLLAMAYVGRMAGAAAAEHVRSSSALSQSEERLRMAIETANDAYIEMDATGVVTDWNARAESAFGWQREEAIGRPLADLIVPTAEREAHRRRHKEFCTGGEFTSAAGHRFEVEVLHRDGHLFPVEVALWRTRSGDTLRIHAFVHDITARRTAAAALADSEASFRLLFEQNPLPMWLYDVETLAFLRVNDAAVEHYGYSRAEFLAMGIADIRPAEDVAALVDTVREPRCGVRRAGLWRHRTKNGEIIDVEIASHRLVFNGQQASLVLAQDVTERLRVEQDLVHQALHDSLTGLPNRNLLIDRLDQALARTQRSESQVAVIFIDLDRFKVINDAKGHNVGDRLLAEVGDRLRTAVRLGDTVARLGGDEFVLVVEGVNNRDHAMTASARIAWALDAPFAIEGAELFLSASQGVAIAEPGESAHDVLARADAAMYEAKDGGRGRSAFADQAIKARSVNRLNLESALRDGLGREEFVLHYQPVVAVATGEIVGAEALLRWQHPDLGLLGPDRFIAAAEESGLIVPIGEWVLRRALRDAGEWVNQSRGEAQLSVAVNLSAAQLKVPNLPFIVARVLSSSAVEPSRLHLEVTESVLMRDMNHSRKVLAALRELGIRIDVDDFGTGYSSLAYVQNLPIDALKIDKSFVDRLEGPHPDSSIVEAVLSLGRSLHLAVVAEGVESEGQRLALTQLECQLAQGYWFARPVPLARFLELLDEGVLPPTGSSPVPAVSTQTISSTP